jgi:hypothetical protein
MFELLGNVLLMTYQKYIYFFVKFLKCAKNVLKPSHYPAPFSESCGKVVCKITIEQSSSKKHMVLRTLCASWDLICTVCHYIML